MLGYCSSVWDTQHKGLILQIERVQGFAARLATGHWEADWRTLCADLGWSSMALRRTHESIRMCRRILLGNSIIPSDVFEKESCLRSSRVTKHNYQLHIPFARTAQHQQSFFIRSANLWNSLTPELVDTYSDASFKRRLSDHLSLC